MKDLIDTLEALRIRLNKSGVERTTGLKQTMSDHENCSFYRKSKDLYLRKDHDELRALFLEALEQYRLVEGDKFGR